MTAAVANYDRKTLRAFALRISFIFAGLVWLEAATPTLTYADVAGAGATRVHLQWNRPAGSTCVGQAEVAKRVEAQLGRSVFVSDQRAAVHIDGKLEQRDGVWVATLRMDEPGAGIHGVRQLQQDQGDCTALTPALVVVLATLIGLAQPESSDDGWVPILGLAAAAGFGVLPKTTAGGSVWLGLTLSDAWLLWADATAWLPVEKVDALQRGGKFSAWQAGLSLCHVLAGGDRLALAVCAGGQLGIVTGAGRGLGQNRSSQQLLAQSGLEAALSLRLFASLALRTSAGAALALSRPSFFLELPDGTHREIYHAAPVDFFLRAGLTLELR
jgi:hypothetical protein